MGRARQNHKQRKASLPEGLGLFLEMVAGKGKRSGRGYGEELRDMIYEHVGVHCILCEMYLVRSAGIQFCYR